MPISGYLVKDVNPTILLPFLDEYENRLGTWTLVWQLVDRKGKLWIQTSYIPGEGWALPSYLCPKLKRVKDYSYKKRLGKLGLTTF